MIRTMTSALAVKENWALNELLQGVVENADDYSDISITKHHYG